MGAVSPLAGHGGDSPLDKHRQSVDQPSGYENKLIAGLDDPLPDVATTCAWILGERGAIGAVQALCDALARRADLIDVCVAVIRALANIGDERAVPSLSEAARHGPVKVRLHAVEALGRFDHQEAYRTLRHVARSDRSTRVREAAMRSLADAGTTATG